MKDRRWFVLPWRRARISFNPRFWERPGRLQPPATSSPRGGTLFLEWFTSNLDGDCDVSSDVEGVRMEDTHKFLGIF